MLYISKFAGTEVNYQIALQTTLLLMTLTETATTSGLQTFFQQDSFLGIPMKPTTALILSTVWSLKTCVMLHLKTIKIPKGFFGIKATCVVLLWALMASIRRILGMVCFFVPSIGLFNILNHWLAEQYPFGIRQQNYLIHPSRYHMSDQIHLFNLTEPVLWKDLDRWNYYGDINEPTPPPYSLYTGFSLKWTFVVFLIMMFFHFVSIFIVKTFTSNEFRRDGTYNKLMHVMQNVHCAFPYKDWDEDEGKSETKEVFKIRFHKTEKEMICSQLINIGMSMIMLIPIWFTGLFRDVYFESICL